MQRNDGKPETDVTDRAGGAAGPGRGRFDARGMRLGIFVLAYNAENLLAETLRRIPEEIWDAVEIVYVVDDCSQDETTRAALDFPHHRDKLRVLRNKLNLRYGGNQKFGYQYAIDRGLDAVVMLHGDGQYAPELLPEVFRPLVERDADMVNASRMIDRRGALAGGMPKYKFVANIGLTAFENLFSGLRMSEFHSGYRGYSTRFLRRIPPWENSDEWHFDSQILFQAKAAGAKIVEIPIPTHYGDEICHVNGISYGLHCLASATAFALHRSGLVCLRRYDLRPAHLAENRRSSEPYSDHSIIARRLLAAGVRGKRVLDLGIGCAAITAKLKEAGAVLEGVDINPAAIAENGALYDRAWVGDANRIDELPIEGKYDIILLSDLLQYLVDPADVLSKLKKRLVKGGTLVVNIPNVANVHVRLALLAGRFRTHHRGILDEKALHFYERGTLRRLLKRTGWRIDAENASGVPLVRTIPLLARPVFRPLGYLGRAFTVCRPGLFASYLIVFCTNPNESDLL